MNDQHLSFKSLQLYGWRQFAKVDLQFHPRLTVLTGANAAGKTTLLNILGQQVGWPTQFISTPRRDQKRGALRYFSGLSDLLGFTRPAESPGQASIGVVEYSNGVRSELMVPEDPGGPAFAVQYAQPEAVVGLLIPSHRWSAAYSPVNQIPVSLPSGEQMLREYLVEVQNAYAGAGGKSPGFRMKESLIALATFGYGNPAVEEDPLAIALFEGFQRVLSRLLPPSMQFRKISIRRPEVVLETGTGDFPIDSISGGVASVIDLAWQIYMRSRDRDRFVVLIDEPENHLHPEMQRLLLPTFLAAFPGIQLITATHNPLIIGSVPDSHVYVLRHDRGQPQRGRRPLEQTVSSVHLDAVNKAGDANELLTQALGVPVTEAIWVERRLVEIFDRYEGVTLDEKTIRDLYADMAALGMADVFPRHAQRLLHRDQAD